MVLKDTIEDLSKVFKEGDKVAVGLSGGLDSTTLLHYLAQTAGPENVFALSFAYGQRHDIELKYAKKQVKMAKIPSENYKVIDISFLKDIVGKASAMVSGGLDVPLAKDVTDNPQPATYVPMRNMIFSSLLGSFAESNGCKYIAIGVQHSDNTGYWDCTKDFANAMQEVFNLNRRNKITLLTPFVNATKSDEILLGTSIGVDYKKTWTSYSGPKRKDGKPWVIGIDDRSDPAGPYSVSIDASAADRKEAFELIGLTDPIPYI